MVRYISASALLTDPAHLETIAEHAAIIIRGCGPIPARLRRVKSGRIVAAFHYPVDLKPILQPRKPLVSHYIPEVADRSWRPAVSSNVQAA